MAEVGATERTFEDLDNTDVLPPPVNVPDGGKATPLEGDDPTKKFQDAMDGNDDDGDDEEGGNAGEDENLAAQYGLTVEDINYAKKMGWCPQEKFRGDPKQWRDPAEFIRVTEESVPVMRDRNRKMAADMKAMQQMFPKVLEMQRRDLEQKHADAVSLNADLQKQLDEAIELGDAKNAALITRKMAETAIKAHAYKGDLEAAKKQGVMPVTPEGRDPEAEEEWAAKILPGLTLEQRETYKAAVSFIEQPMNKDKSTAERIKYVEDQIFGRKTAPGARTPAAPMVGRSSGFTPAGGGDGGADKSGWANMTGEERRIALSVVEDMPWFKTKDSDPKSAAEFARFKKSFK